MIASFTPQPRAARVMTEPRPRSAPALAAIPETFARNFIVADAAQLAALELYERGLNVFPLVRGTKDKPYCKWERLQTTRLINPSEDAAARETFLLAFQNANVAIITGRTSRNLAVVDCETWETAELYRAQFAQRGYVCWIAKTARGAHLYFLSADGELANLKPRGATWELRGNACYVLAPPSVHPTGAIYEWLERAGDAPPTIPLGALDFLGAQLLIKTRRVFTVNESRAETDALACLSKPNRAFCENGAYNGNRNAALFRAACDFAGNGTALEDARPYLLQGCEKSGYDKSFTRRHVERTLESAYSKRRSAARSHFGETPKRAPLAVWKRAQMFADAHAWQPLTARVQRRKITVSAQSARSVFEACIERARCEDARTRQSKFRASVREVAELANIERGTAYKALHCLTMNHFLVWQGANAAGANLYAFGEMIEKRNAPERDSTSTTIITTVAFWRVDAFADVFRRNGLGQTAGRAWLAILEKPMTALQLAARLNVKSAGTIRKALAQLDAHNLARRVESQRGAAWIGERADADALASIAARCGTRGKASHRRERHAREREQDVTNQILRARAKDMRRELWAELRAGGVK